MAQRITMQHIADAVHMSRASVSAVLGNKPNCFVSEKKRAQIHETAIRMGYTPNLLARGLRNGRTNMIGLLCSSIQSEINKRELVCLVNLLLEHGYSSNIIYYKGELEKLRASSSELMARGCDALIVSRAQHSTENEEHTIVNSFTDKAVFLFAGNPEQTADHDIVYDFRAGFLEAAAYLKKLGHRNIKMLMHISDPHDPGMIGFQEALEHLDLDSASSVCEVSSVDAVSPDFMEGFLRNHPACTALVCRNDVAAMRVIQSCAKLGIRVPGDLSVIGFDDIDTSAYSVPALTTIRQPVEAAAEETVKLLLNMLEGQSNPICHSLAPRLIIRESTTENRAKTIKHKRNI